MSLAQEIINPKAAGKTFNPKWLNFSKTLFKVLLTATGIFALWLIVYYLMVEIFRVWIAALFPHPVDVIISLYDHIQNGMLLRAIWSSVVRLFFGFGIALPLGIFSAWHWRAIAVSSRSLGRWCWGYRLYRVFAGYRWLFCGLA